MRLDLIDLRLFLNVAEAASITRGGAKTHMALASASERIRGMEEALGVTLLERGRRGVRLTPAGGALVRHAQIVVQQIERMRGELAGYSTGLKGHVRVLANTAALSEFLPDTLKVFLSDNPNIDIDLEERPSQEIVRSVAEGFAHAGLVANIVDFEGLETFSFAIDRLVLVLPHDHPFAFRDRPAFRSLLDQEFVGLGATSALQRHLEQHALQAGRPLKVRLRLSNFDAICRMVESGVGLAVMPETAALRNHKSMAIQISHLADSWSLRHLSICVRRLAELPAHAQQLVHHLRMQPMGSNAE